MVSAEDWWELRYQIEDDECVKLKMIIGSTEQEPYPNEVSLVMDNRDPPTLSTEDIKKLATKNMQDCGIFQVDYKRQHKNNNICNSHKKVDFASYHC